MACAMDADMALAMLLHEEELRLAGRPHGADEPTPPPPTSAVTSLVDEAYELMDPTPDIYQLFRDFDSHFFCTKLGSVELKWSPRMTRCAGVCSYQPGSGLCSIRLSKPLLTLRPRSDLVETLLHEMIHALLFVTHSSDNREDHGPEFRRHMRRINKAAGTNITVYHTFHDECRAMLTHWWRCSGTCRNRRPYFGFVKRSMNRTPGPNDFWWSEHQASCGGQFEKIREPDGYGQSKKAKKEKASSASSKLQDIRNFMSPGSAMPKQEQSSKRKTGFRSGGRTKKRPVMGAPGNGRPTVATPRSEGVPHLTPATLTPPPVSTMAAGRGVSGAVRDPPSDVHSGIGTVDNASKSAVHTIANNVHGFQQAAIAGVARPHGGSGALGSRSSTVTVGPRPPAAVSDLVVAPFSGAGNVLGGSHSVPWYRRLPSASGTEAPPVRSPAGIFTTSPETDVSGRRPHCAGPLSPETDVPGRRPHCTWPPSSETDVPGRRPHCAGPPSPSRMVTCPVCSVQVLADTINEHVDACLLVQCGASGMVVDPAVVTAPPPCAVRQESSEDELAVAEAAGELESSLEVSATGGRTAPADDGHDVTLSPRSDASTAYDDILNEPIVIDSDDDGECGVQRVNLSESPDRIKQFIHEDESDDDIF